MMKAQLILTLALLLTSTGAVLAQTPDGQTPAEETVCDHESGAAFGLCNAYCEAMDCDSANPQASATACGKVKAKFTNITGRTSLPCEVPPVICPCNDPAVNQPFADTVAGLRDILSCKEGTHNGITLTLSPSGSVTANPFNSLCGAFGVPALPTTPEQAQLCVQLLEQAAANQGVTCQAEP
jgi:hypothetical protein